MKKFNYYALALSNMIVKVLSFVMGFILMIQSKSSDGMSEKIGEFFLVLVVLVGVVSIISLIYYIYEERSKAVLASSILGLFSVLFLVKGTVDLIQAAAWSIFSEPSIPATFIFACILITVSAVYDVLIYLQMSRVVSLDLLVNVTPVPTQLKNNVVPVAQEKGTLQDEKTQVAQEPVVEAPQVEETPAVEEPVVEAPQVEETPVVEEPVVEASQVEETPVAEEPVVEVSQVEEAPVVEEPVVEAPQVEEAPVVEEPVVEASQVEENSTETNAQESQKEGENNA